MEEFGGTNIFDMKTYEAQSAPYGQAQFHTTISIPPLACIILQPVTA